MFDTYIDHICKSLNGYLLAHLSFIVNELFRPECQSAHTKYRTLSRERERDLPELEPDLLVED